MAMPTYLKNLITYTQNIKVVATLTGFFLCGTIVKTHAVRVEPIAL